MNFLFSKFPINNNVNVINYDHYSCANYKLFVEKDKCETYRFDPNLKVIIIGDCINFLQVVGNDKFSFSMIKKLKGVFTLIVINDQSFEIHSSFFGMLPIYFSKNYNSISNSLELIKLNEGNTTSINKRFILESYLFNYPLFDQTYLVNVKRFESFKSLIYKNDSFNIFEIENVYNWFSDNPSDGKKSIEKLAELFLNEIKHYFAPERNSVTFTSGFDGRSIVGAGIYHGSNFETFSMGRPENDDVYNPMSNAKDLNIPYHYYNLVGEEYQDSYFEMSVRMSSFTGGYNGFLYPHFLYGPVKEKQKNDVLLTGYCGSELFRALHIEGAVTSKELVMIFNEPDDEKLRKALWDSPKLLFLNRSDFVQEFNDLFDEVVAFRRTKTKNISQNRFFYHYIFKEVFRKVFGSWTTAQFEELKVRIPFLDYSFISELLKTDLAGCNNEFFTHNPFKRIKGQLLYAEIIRQSSPQLFDLYTGKGYRPSDLCSFLGKMRISLPYAKKKIIRKATKEDLDNLGLISNYLRNEEVIIKAVKNLDFVNQGNFQKASNNLHNTTPESQRDMVFQTASFTAINRI